MFWGNLALGNRCCVVLNFTGNIRRYSYIYVNLLLLLRAMVGFYPEELIVAVTFHICDILREGTRLWDDSSDNRDHPLILEPKWSRTIQFQRQFSHVKGLAAM